MRPKAKKGQEQHNLSAATAIVSSKQGHCQRQASQGILQELLT